MEPPAPLCGPLLASYCRHVQVERVFSPSSTAVFCWERTVSVGEHSLQVQQRSFNQSVSVSRRVNLPNALEPDAKYIKSLYGGQGV